jgi:hypothetical protein
MNFYCFDFHGAYLGHMDGSGTFFDGRGCKWARLADGRKVYDLDGIYRGHIDAQGSFFSERGICRGYLRGWTDDERSCAGVQQASACKPQPDLTLLGSHSLHSTSQRGRSPASRSLT